MLSYPLPLDSANGSGFCFFGFSHHYSWILLYSRPVNEFFLELLHNGEPIFRKRNQAENKVNEYDCNPKIAIISNAGI